MKRLFFQNETLWSVVVGKLKTAVELAAFRGSEPPKAVQTPTLESAFPSSHALIVSLAPWSVAAAARVNRARANVARWK